jgi:hypothetical protein
MGSTFGGFNSNSANAKQSVEWSRGRSLPGGTKWNTWRVQEIMYSHFHFHFRGSSIRIQALWLIYRSSDHASPCSAPFAMPPSSHHACMRLSAKWPQGHSLNQSVKFPSGPLPCSDLGIGPRVSTRTSHRQTLIIRVILHSIFFPAATRFVSPDMCQSTQSKVQKCWVIGCSRQEVGFLTAEHRSPLAGRPGC